MQPVARRNFSEEECPIARALDVVGDTWSILVIREAMTGVRRFNEFASRLGVAKNILADRLKKLVANGILRVVPASDGSAYSEYQITRKGIELSYVLIALRQWSNAWIPGACDATLELVDLKNREPVKPLELHASDGRLLTLKDVTVQRKVRRAARAS